jgi:hypothetical protein
MSSCGRCDTEERRPQDICEGSTTDYKSSRQQKRGRGTNFVMKGEAGYILETRRLVIAGVSGSGPQAALASVLAKGLRLGTASSSCRFHPDFKFVHEQLINEK